MKLLLILSFLFSFHLPSLSDSQGPAFLSGISASHALPTLEQKKDADAQKPHQNLWLISPPLLTTQLNLVSTYTAPTKLLVLWTNSPFEDLKARAPPVLS